MVVPNLRSAALVKEKYGLWSWELFKACFARERLLVKRNAFLYKFKTVQITIIRSETKPGTVEGGGKFYGVLFFSLVNVMLNGMAELAMTIFRL